jgi:hypothetical protein
VTCALAQSADPAPASTAELNRELQQTRSELEGAKREIKELRISLEELRAEVKSSSPTGTVPVPTDEPSVATADQNPAFLAAKINEIHQDKVESASKYPVKLSGLVLFNSYWDRGIVDVQDLPNLALPQFPGASKPGLGATLRQTVFGLNAMGPKIFGARTSAEAEVDFAGGSPSTDFGVTAGLLRLRTAKVTLDWTNNSLTIGQDNLFFSPLSPSSYATVAEPAFSWSGNLWVWTPAITATHRSAINESLSLVLQGGVMDPLTEQVPLFQGRVASAGEVARVPAIAGRIAVDRTKETNYPFTIGFGGYRANQQYQSFPTVASWTLNSDLKLGVGKHLEFSGELYEGRAVGGLGGGIWSSVVFPDAAEPHSAIHPLRSTGGWGQVKIIPATRFEINAAFGQDENYGQDLRVFPVSFTDEGYTPLQKNRTKLVNFIYRPTSILLFAVEYRHLFTQPTNSPAETADHLNLAAGVHF